MTWAEWIIAGLAMMQLVFLFGGIVIGYGGAIKLHMLRYDRLIAKRDYYRDMWLAQRVENENYRKQLGLVAVSDEAERELSGSPPSVVSHPRGSR